jgi:hypothetical protein
VGQESGLAGFQNRGAGVPAAHRDILPEQELFGRSIFYEEVDEESDEEILAGLIVRGRVGAKFAEGCEC